MRFVEDDQHIKHIAYDLHPVERLGQQVEYFRCCWSSNCHKCGCGLRLYTCSTSTACSVRLCACRCPVHFSDSSRHGKWDHGLDSAPQNCVFVVFCVRSLQFSTPTSTDLCPKIMQIDHSAVNFRRTSIWCMANREQRKSFERAKRHVWGWDLQWLHEHRAGHHIFGILNAGFRCPMLSTYLAN